MNNKLVSTILCVTVGVILVATLLVPTVDSATYTHTTYENEDYSYLATRTLSESVEYTLDSSNNLLANGEIVASASVHSAGVSAPSYGFQSYGSGAWAYTQATGNLVPGSATLTPAGVFSLGSGATATSSGYIAAVVDGDLAAYSLHEGAATFKVTEGHAVILTANYSQLTDGTPLAWRATLVGDQITVDYATIFDSPEGHAFDLEITINSSTTIATEDGVTTYSDFNVVLTGFSGASRVVAIVDKEYQDSIEMSSSYTAIYMAIPVIVIAGLLLTVTSTFRRD